MTDAELMKGKRILIVDDVVSTGESLRKIPLFDKDANVIGENPNPTAYVK